MSVEITGVSQCRVGLAPTLLGNAACLGSDRDGLSWVGAVGGDRRVPSLAGADDCVQMSQDRGSDHGMSLRDFQLVRLASGQMGEAGGIDGVGSLGSPDRTPGRES